MKKLHTIDELLNNLPYLERLQCDEDLEEYIIANCKEKGYLPKLREINRVSINIEDKEQRAKEKQIRQVMDKIWMFAGNYRLVSNEQMDEESIWYIMDEVGSSISHSDVPNLAVHPFIYAPNNEFDAQTITYSICWPLKDTT